MTTSKLLSVPQIAKALNRSRFHIWRYLIKELRGPQPINLGGRNFFRECDLPKIRKVFPGNSKGEATA
jgi:hypothetical protein